MTDDVVDILNLLMQRLDGILTTLENIVKQIERIADVAEESAELEVGRGEAS